MDILGGSGSEDEGGVQLKINKKYAKGYDKWRSKEEKQKLIDKYGDVRDGSSSSSDEEEIKTTKQMDKDWLRAFAVVRFQQPRLYREGEKFFHETAEPVYKKKEKATTLKDHERKFILEKGGIESDEDVPPKPQGKSYFEEQEEIKESFKEAVENSSSDDDEDGLLVKKEKSKEEKLKEENEYLEWLKGEREELEDEEAAKELAPLKAYWNDPNLPEKEKVLRDYVLNNGYMDEEESDDSDESEGPDRDEEEEFLEKADLYEHKYNFRHEEPGADEIKSYPRVIEESVRIKDTRRIEQRQRRMERKRMEKQQREEEIRLLQKLHKEERKEKLKKLQEAASNPLLKYDLEADFDPTEHDKIMQSYFGTDYYGDADGNEKPEFEYDAAIDDDDPDDWWSERMKEEQAEEEDANANDDRGEEEYYEEETNFNMDADFNPDETRKSKKDKKSKSKKEKKAQSKLPLFDPTKKTFDEYIDEYLKDKIGSLPFTYREVMPNDYGLSTEEILTAQEKELNAWVGVKRMSQYRSNQEEMADKRKFASRSKQPDKKFKVIPSLLQKSKVGSKKKKRKGSDSESSGSEAEEESQVENSEIRVSEGGPDQKSESPGSKQKKKRKYSKSDATEGPVKKKKKGKESFSLDSPEKVEDIKDRTSQLKKGKSLSFQMDEKIDKAVKTKKKKLKDKRVESKAELNGPGVVNSPTSKEVGTSQMKLNSEMIRNSEKSDTKKKKKKPKVNSAGKGVETGQQAHSVSKKVYKNLSESDHSKLFSASESAQEQSAHKTKSGLKKKKKISINMFDKGSSVSKHTIEGDRKKLKQNLSQVMSAERLKKFGIGPGAAKGTKKKKKRKSHKFVSKS